ncbi:ABC transporter substrate-binding protein [Falsiroseomonas selenitidurans]|uniref:ABC transporter substrate-binding protein n=1 Tax=Falsiroseomonas selenitidurans TaxID=2716335 RepID=A0ABX1DY90_9PROT|nr:ABC transporter substrate-binding protein [Falsiroseomonas selenitidurans]NKC29882.1 ABC transporter substrate-binding protein [Falsiroseomonas selenitidurans]
MIIKTTRRALRGALGALALGALLAGAPAAQATTFTWATANDILGLDPHANNHGVTNTMKSNVYEPLVRREPDGSLSPALAERWELVSPTVWRFHLRRGVKFHGGEAFTAADVAHALERVKQNDMAYTVQSVAAVRVIDDHTVEIETRGPNPILLQDLTLFFITSKAWIEANNAFAVARAGQPGATSTFVQLNANGTGPFRVVERLADERTVLVPNPDWWGQAQHGITRAVFRPVASAPTRVAAILSRELDAMYHVPLQDVQRVSQAPGLRLIQGPTARTIYFAFDVQRAESLDAPGQPNPLRDVRVRRAMYQAIDMGTITRVILRNATIASGLPIGTAISGFVEAQNQRLPYDPAASRRLLAEAGYPNGFPITLHCPNNRYVNDEAICQAATGMLQRAGIQARLEAIPFGRFLQRGANKEYQFYLLGWTPGNFDITNPGRELLGEGSFNWGGFQDDRMAALLREIQVETDQPKRQALAAQYWARFQELLPMIPLHQEPQIFAVRDTVAELPLRANEDLELRHVRMRR